MNKKDELLKVRQLYEEIQYQEEYCERLRSMVESPRSASIKEDPVQADMDVHRNQKIMDELIDQQNRIKDMYEEYDSYRIKVMTKINMIGKDLQRNVLLMRYIDFKRLVDVAKELSYSSSHIKKASREALKSYSELECDI